MKTLLDIENWKKNNYFFFLLKKDVNLQQQYTPRDRFLLKTQRPRVCLLL